MIREDESGKEPLRRSAIAARNALTAEDRKEKDARITELFISDPWYFSAKQLLIYAAFQSETGTEEMIRHALKEGRQVFCPAVTGRREMVFCALEGELREHILADGLAAMKKSRLGIPEPDPSVCRHYRYRPQESLMLMPGTVFDGAGNRAGYGGGFYDTFLSRNPMRTVAVFYDCQRTDRTIPAGAHDIRPDRILTESGWFAPSAPKHNG